MKFKIAVAQVKLRTGTEEDNRKKFVTFIKKASEKGAQLIVFPEEFTTHPTIENNVPDTKQAHKLFFSKIAKKYHIDIVPGSAIEKENGKLYNVTYYISAEGKVLGRYKKINLWLPERAYIAPGKEQAVVVNTKFGKVGLIICYDLMSPELFRALIRKGAEIIICPSLWGYADGMWGLNYDKNTVVNLVDSLCPARAFENGIILVYCNVAGKFEGKVKDSSIGHSQVTAPFYGVLKKLDHNQEEMFIQEIDTKLLKDAEKSFKVRYDLKKRRSQI